MVAQTELNGPGGQAGSPGATSTPPVLQTLNGEPSPSPSATATQSVGAASSEASPTAIQSAVSSPKSPGGGSNLPTSITPISASSAPVAGGSGTNAGVIAGAAVGAAVGAAIITFLITFMFLRKKKQNHRRHEKHRSGSGGLSTYTEKALPKDPSQGGDAVSAVSTWQKHLPQSADDTTIRSSVKTLFDQVELHVENFYRDVAVQITETLQAELLRVDSPHLPESIVDLLPRARSQTALIKHCLLSYVVASISTDDNSVQSLLPTDYATLPHLVRATGQKKPGYDQAISQWRVLSAYLRPSPKNDQKYLSQRDANVSAAATAFTNAFSVWASSAYSDSARRQNVAEIFKSAAEVGILIFSQPSSFTYQWGTSQDNRGGVVVVTPAFLKISDENARVLERPQVMIQMATQSI